MAKDYFVCAQIIPCNMCSNTGCKKNSNYNKKMGKTTFQGHIFEYYTCMCDRSIGENCEECNS